MYTGIHEKQAEDDNGLLTEEKGSRAGIRTIRQEKFRKMEKTKKMYF